MFLRILLARKFRSKNGSSDKKKSNFLQMHKAREKRKVFATSSKEHDLKSSPSTSQAAYTTSCSSFKDRLAEDKRKKFAKSTRTSSSKSGSVSSVTNNSVSNPSKDVSGENLGKHCDENKQYTGEQTSKTSKTGKDSVTVVPRKSMLLLDRLSEGEKKKTSKTVRNTNTSTKPNSQCKERYYYDDSNTFKDLLEKYNRIGEHKKSEIVLECAGYVNTTMHMCCCCRDNDKGERKKDRYYINTKEIAKTRTILCHGCVGARLRKLELSKKL